MTQSIRGAKDALYEACVDLYDSVNDTGNGKVGVTFGPPGKYQPNIIVGVAMATRQPVERPTMGTNRSREKAAEIDTVFSVYVPGSEVKQQVADDTCNDLIDLFEDYFRTSPNEELGGACRDSWVSNIDGPNPGVATNPQTGAVTGRIAEATVTVIARIRY